MIEVHNLVKRFGGVLAVNDVTLSIEPGSITGLIGPNGAGKTTLFNCIAGAFPPSSGHVLLDGDDITGLAQLCDLPHHLNRTFCIQPDEFQVAGEDGTFVDAEARIDGKIVVVRADGVKSPRHVRFGWHRTANPNLVNSEGLPASPFQTDNWSGGTGE